MNNKSRKFLPPAHSSLHSSRLVEPQFILLMHSLYDKNMEARSREMKTAKIDKLKNYI